MFRLTVPIYSLSQALFKSNLCLNFGKIQSTYSRDGDAIDTGSPLSISAQIENACLINLAQFLGCLRGVLS